MSAITDAISIALPDAFVVGSGVFVWRFLRPEMRRDGLTLAVIILGAAVGACWAWIPVRLVSDMSPLNTLLTFASGMLITVAGSLDVWAVATRAPGRGGLAVFGTVLIGALTAPALTWTAFSIGSTGQDVDREADARAIDGAIRDRSAPMSLVVRDASLTPDGAGATYSPGGQGVKAIMRLQVDLVSTSEFSVDRGSPIVWAEATRPGVVKDLASFSTVVPELPDRIPVGTTPLYLVLYGRVNAGADIDSAGAVWTLFVQFNWSGPGTGYVVTTTFKTPLWEPCC